MPGYFKAAALAFKAPSRGPVSELHHGLAVVQVSVSPEILWGIWSLFCLLHLSLIPGMILLDSLGYDAVESWRKLQTLVLDQVWSVSLNTSSGGVLPGHSNSSPVAVVLPDCCRSVVPKVWFWPHQEPQRHCYPLFAYSGMFGLVPESYRQRIRSDTARFSVTKVILFPRDSKHKLVEFFQNFLPLLWIKV